MKFAKIVFLIAGILGLLELTPLYFMFNIISRQDPPAITHPAFFYGFVGIGLAWQIAFLVISRDPVRLRPIMIPAVIEKFAYAGTAITLYMQSRLHASDLTFGILDLLFGILFLSAFFKTSTASAKAIPAQSARA
jgi:hypothetical protein